MVTSVPTGLVTFLFTDVEGSTRLWQSDSDGMRASLERHDQIMRSAVADHDGHVFSTAGDAFAVAFHRPDHALAAALDAQLQMAAAEWPGPALAVRMGIHTGTADERDGDYFGTTLNRAARLMSAGHGGQVLVSSATVETAGGPAGFSDLGVHRLKDLDEPEHVFELRHPDLPVVTRPIRTADVALHNLPDYLTTFVGREFEIDSLRHDLSVHRLTVLAGVGGTGKTRLAVETARAMAEDYADGVWLVELAPVTNPQLIMTVVGDTWGLRPGEGASIDDVVTRYLWSRHVLLVIDNCEHVLDGSASAIKQILTACPKVTVLATSRESLGVPGEHLVRVPSMSLPADSLLDAESVRLFLDRARAARPDFEIGESDHAAIRRIVTRIDGIPLGLELAAARLRSLSLSELADRLEDSFRILSGSAKAALPRQRTLHATIDWSYDLLEPDEQTVFRRASVFTGGFTLAAAERVCAGGDVEDFEVLDFVDSMVDKSLATVVSRGTETRYRMLEPVRQYAQERLSDSGEAGDVRLTHAGYFSDFVAEVSPALRGPDQVAAQDRLTADYDNIRAAFVTLLEAGEFERHIRMAFELFSFWMHEGMQIEGIETALAGLDAGTDVDPTVRVKTWFTTALLGAEITRPSSVDHARRGLAEAEATGDEHLIGRMEFALGCAIRHATTDPEYLEHLLEGRRMLDANPEPYWWDRKWEAGFRNLMLAGYLPPDDDRSLGHLRAALETFEEVGDPALLAASLSDSTMQLGKVEDAWIQSNLERAVRIFEKIRSPYWQGHTLYYLGILHTLSARHAEAIPPLSKGRVLLDDAGDMNCWAGASRYLAIAEAATGKPVQAAHRLLPVLEVLPLLPLQEVAQARTLDASTSVLIDLGRFEDAAVVLGTAKIVPMPDSIVDRFHERYEQAVVDGLGPDRAGELLERGASMSADEALAIAARALADA